MAQIGKKCLSFSEPSRVECVCRLFHELIQEPTLSKWIGHLKKLKITSRHYLFHLMRRVGRDRDNSLPAMNRVCAYCVCLHPIGLNLADQSHLTAVVAGKYRLWLGSGRCS